jgi:hypothetical protein
MIRIVETLVLPLIGLRGRAKDALRIGGNW